MPDQLKAVAEVRCHVCGGTNASLTLMEKGWEHDEPIYCAWAERDRLREALKRIRDLGSFGERTMARQIAADALGEKRS